MTKQVVVVGLPIKRKD